MGIGVEETRPLNDRSGVCAYDGVPRYVVHDERGVELEYDGGRDVGAGFYQIHHALRPEVDEVVNSGENYA